MNHFQNINKNHNIMDIAMIMANKLNINHSKLEIIIKDRIPNYEEIILDNLLVDKINLLLQSDIEISNFESNISSPTVLENFNKLKEHLAELQVSTLIKKLRKAKNSDDILNSFLIVLNNKFDAVNNILKESVQSGGHDTSKINFYAKYLKYKFKNEEIITNISTI